MLVSVLGIILLDSCGKKGNPTPNQPNPKDTTSVPNGPLGVTSTSPEYVLWGEELTINGQGFHPNPDSNFVWLTPYGTLYTHPEVHNTRNDSLGWRKAEIISASPNKLVFKVPYIKAAPVTNNRHAGEIVGRFRIIVGENAITSPVVKLIGIPRITSMCYNTSGIAGAAIVPDHTLNNRISIDGLGTYGREDESNLISRLKLYVNGTPVDMIKTPNTVTGCANQHEFKIPVSFATGNCTNGIPDPIQPAFTSYPANFELRIENKTVDSWQPPFEYRIRDFPQMSLQSFSQAYRTFSKSSSVAETTITGKNVAFYDGKVRYCPVQNTGEPCQTTDAIPISATELLLSVPTLNLNGGLYHAIVLGPCGKTTIVGTVNIVP